MNLLLPSLQQNMSGKNLLPQTLVLVIITLGFFFSVQGLAAQHQGPEYLLALSWQPAFCQTRSHLRECRNQNADRFDADHFSLHGLWPQPRNKAYCGVSKKNKDLDKRRKWANLPSLGLPSETFLALGKRMPGVASYLHRHEWIKHGSCYGASPKEYFLDALSIVKQINVSPVRDLFAKNIGRIVTSQAIRSKFDSTFGKGAGKKVRIRCSKGMIGEIWINLRGEITANTKLTDLLKKAKKTKPDCSKGLVDPVGY